MEFFISINIALIQLSNVYLRYLPFRSNLTEDETRKFWIKILKLCSILITADTILFLKFGILPLIYKMMFLIGWLSYFAMSVLFIKDKFKNHIFVLGMQGLWAILLQTLASITISLLKNFFVVNEIFMQGLIYLVFFAILWRFEIKLFENVLPARPVMEQHFKWYIAILPLPMLFGITTPMMDNIFIHSFKERLVRFFIPLFFFLVYRSLSNLTLQLEKKNQQEYFNRILNHQLQSLKTRDLIIQENQKSLAVFRHDLRHNCRLIAAMLKEGKIQNAIDFISKQDMLLRQTESEKDSSISVLQSVISIYRQKAQENSIKFDAKINLPINYNSGDVTILLSNLLDNAINFSKSDPPNEREIFLLVSYDEDSIFIDIANSFNEKIIFDESGLPRWNLGNGMKTLLTFRDKHFAKIKFVQTEKRLNISIYFRY